jgi:predicted cation transporter
MEAFVDSLLVHILGFAGYLWCVSEVLLLIFCLYLFGQFFLPLAYSLPVVDESVLHLVSCLSAFLDLLYD